jgi:hypothetical protein
MDREGFLALAANLGDSDPDSPSDDGDLSKINCAL